MVATAGLRERKKQQTRDALTAAAMRLFQERGYEHTTVAEIADAAGVSTKTLFNYFAGKEDVLFAHRRLRIETMAQLIAERGASEPPVDLLSRAVDTVLGDVADDGPGIALNMKQTRLIMSVPELRARALLLIAEAQRTLATSLREAYPGRFDELTALALVGSLIGAMQAAALASFDRDDPPEETVAEVRKAAEVALRGLAATVT